MLKKLILSAFLISSTYLCYSQAMIMALIFGDKVASEEFNISLEAGLASSYISNVDFGASRNLGGQFGIGCNIKLSDNFYLNPSAYFFSVRSVKVKNAPVYQGENVDIIPDSADAVVRAQYIDVPLFLNYRFNNSRWAIGFAPQVSFRMDARGFYEFDNGEEFSAQIKDLVDNIDYGIIGSVSYALSTARGGKTLVFSLRYYQGFNDVFVSGNNLGIGENKANYIGLVASFPFITDELAQKNLDNN